jgi:hypothetical protein
MLANNNGVKRLIVGHYMYLPRNFSTHFKVVKPPAYHKEDLQENPDFQKFTTLLAKSLSPAEMKSSLSKIEHILSEKQVYTKMFNEKPKMIKYSLQLFTVDEDH